MAENDKTTASVQPQTAQTPTQEQAPVTQEAAPKSTENSSGGKAAVTVSQGKSARLLEINEKLNSGILSVDERAKLEEEKKGLEKEGEADGETNELKNDDIKKDDPKDNKFTEQDIIKYMYNEWLIALGCWCGKKIEKAVGTGFYKMERRIIQRNARRRAEKDSNKKSNSYQNYQKLGAIKDKTAEEIKKRDHDRVNTVRNLAQAIAEGKMVSESATDLLALAKYMDVKPENVQDNSEIKKIVEASHEHKKIKEEWYQSLGISAQDVENNKKLAKTEMKKLKKENPQQYEIANEKQEQLKLAQKKLCELGARFAHKEERKIAFDSMMDQTAISLAEAKMLDTIAHTKNGNPYPDLTDEFKKQSAQYRNDLTEMTAEERQRFIDGQNKQKIYTNVGTYVEINSMGSIEQMNNLALRASNSAGRNFENFKVEELGKKPRRNKPLENMEKNISNFKDKGKEPTSEELSRQEAEAQIEAEKDRKENAEEAKKETQKEEKEARNASPKSLEEEASDRKQEKEKQAAAQSSFEAHKSNIDDRTSAHEARGKSILLYKNRIKAQHQQQLVAQLAKNNFQGLHYAGKGHEI